MNTRTLASLVLAVAVVSGAHAQTELPGQWVDEQIQAAHQEQVAQARAAAAATRVASLSTTASQAAANTGTAPASASKTAAQK